MRNEEENEDVSGANIRIPFNKKKCEYFPIFSSFTIFCSMYFNYEHSIRALVSQLLGVVVV